MSENKETGSRMLLVLVQNEQYYGIPADRVREVFSMPQITPLPRQPRPLLGVCSYRGSVVPVMSMAQICGTGEENSQVCVILREKTGNMLAIAVERAVRAEEESGEEVSLDLAAANQGLLKLTGVKKERNPVFLVDVEQTIAALREHIERSI